MAKQHTVKEIPSLSLDNIVSIFLHEETDVYQQGLLIGRRSKNSASNDVISLTHPFSVNAFVIVLCEKGEVTMVANTSESHIKENDIYICLPGQIMSGKDAVDCEVLITVISLDFFRDKNLDIKPIAQKLLALKYSQSLTLDQKGFADMRAVVESTASELRNGEDDTTSNEIVRSLVTALFFMIGRAIDRNIDQANTFDKEAFSRNAGYFREFMTILGKYYKQERSVGFYAEQMHLSPKYFTTLIKRTSGQTAAEWINHTVILEAKNLLKYSTMNIQEIAYSLNFPNQSFFGKYFKHHTGMTPSEYKKL